MAKVAVVGPGAIGSVAAAAVQQTGRHELIVCARREPGRIRVLDERSDTTIDVAAPVLTSPSTADGPVEWVLLAVKAHQTTGAAGYLETLCGAGTTLVVLQNGVEHRERVAPFVRDAEVVPGIVWISAETVAPGSVTVGAEVTARIQVPSGAPGEAFAKLMAGSLIEVEQVDDFTTAVWRKLTTNAIAGLMAITGRRAGIFRREDIRTVAHKLSLECVAVARAEGAGLDDEEAARLVNHFTTLPADTGSSILFDRLAGRPLEWDARNDVVRRRGRSHGIATPVSDVLVPLLAATSDG